MLLKRLLNYILVIALTCASVSVLAAGALYYFINTPAGVRGMVDYALLQTAQYGSVTIGAYEGTLADGLILKNVIVQNAPVLGKGAYMHIQRIDLRIPPWAWANIHVNIFNGKLILPDCDNILFNGTYSDGKFHVNSYSRALDVGTIMRPFLPADVMRALSGSISSVELSLDGPISSPRIRGHFYIDRIRFKDTTVKEGLAHYDLTFPDDKGQRTMVGPLVIESGLVNLHRSTLELQKSQAEFKGPFDNPELLVYGTTKADIYTIDIKIDGTLQRPQMHISSDPYLPEDMAMMALGWGNWAVADYSTFNESNDQRVGLKKRVMDDVKLGFELEQRPARHGYQQTTYSQKLAGELAITDRFSFNVAESVLSQRDGTETSATSTNDARRQGESEFYLKYKNTF